jgi:hypothetical protein
MSTPSFTRGRSSAPAAAAAPGAGAQANNTDGGQDYLRSLSPGERSRLTMGKMIKIVDHEGNLVTEFPLALFNAASTKKELLVDGTITLPGPPDELDITQAKRFLFCMLKVAQAAHGVLAPIENTFADLYFHSAAEALGMGSFTQHIFDLYFKRVNNVLPSIQNIKAIDSVHSPAGDKIYRQMAYLVASRYFENQIPNREAFERYLDTDQRLKESVAEIVMRKENKVKVKVQNEASRLAFLERERKREEKVKYEAEREKRNYEYEMEKELKENKFDERKKKEADVRKSMLEKKRAGHKMTPEEARAHEKLFGKAVAF